MTPSALKYFFRRARLPLAVVVVGLTSVRAGAVGPDLPELAQVSRPGNLPFYFEANPDQQSGAFPFYARGQACDFLVAPGEAVLRLTRYEGQAGRARHERSQLPDGQLRATRELHFQFAGANPLARVSGTDERSGRVNYFIGSSAAEWRTGVSLFGRVRVDQIYPGVDLIYYGNEQRLEYDFVVAPQADPKQISIHFSGADKINVSSSGELVFTLGDREIRQPKPVVYQTSHGVRKDIVGSYALTANQTVTFHIGDYDRTQPLIIDPVLSYSTYFGGNGLDIAWAVAVDPNGFVYVAGETMGRLPITPNLTVTNKYSGATNFHGDAFVAKFDSTLTNLIALAYVGGKGGDVALSVAVDAAGDAYITGFTDSPDFPTTNAIYSHINGSPFPGLGVYPIDAFVTKLGPQGTNPLAILYSTYLGGDWVDEGVGIDVDKLGFVYVTGYTASTNTFPTLNGAPGLMTYQGNGDAFVTKISPAGTNLVYSIYLGGTNLDAGSGIKADTNGVAHVTGYSRSTNFPASNLLAGGADAFVTQVGTTNNLAFLVASQLIGGRGDNFGYRIALDAEGQSYVVGSTANDANFPVTPSTLNPGGISRSDNAALNWQDANHGLLSIVATALAIDSGAPAHLFATTWHGLVQSWDGGANWRGPAFVSLTSAGLAPEGAVGTMLSVAIVPGSPATVYAGGSGEGVVKSVDGGTNFLKSGTLTNQIVRALLVDPVTPATVYAGTDAGVFKSADAGTNWSTKNSGLGNLFVRSLALHPESSLYAGTTDGIYRSNDGGTNWSALNTGLSNRVVNALVIQSNAPLVVYAGTAGGVFKSINGGTNWSRMNAGFGPVTNVTTLALDPATPTTIYAGTTNGLFKSVDAGASWTTNGSGLAVQYIMALAINPQSSTTIYAGTKGVPFFGGKDGFVAKSGTNGYFAVLGGSADDEAWDVAVDAANHAHVTGWTASTNFQTANVLGLLRATNSGGADAFVAELSSDGDVLLHSALLGGSGQDFGYGLALDSAGNSYVVGGTASTNFLASTNLSNLATFQSSFGGTNDAFLAKILGESRPTLSLVKVPGSVTLLWPLYWPDFNPEYLLEFSNTNEWGALVGFFPVLKTNGQFSMTIYDPVDQAFFRLRR